MPKRKSKAKVEKPEVDGLPESVIAVTETLGISGWRHLDTLLVAALASQTPLLLVGLHGTAKTMVVERLAEALGLSFRHYNASLLNYDDLVGIPYPDESGESLRFVSCNDSVWGAEFLFFDEISRCRPDLQNKLFPLIHERKVLGRRLEELQHRWAAMNPPFSVDDAGETKGAAYTGSEELDPALADRFGFIINVPAWEELSSQERLAVVRDGGAPRSKSLPVSLGGLLKKTCCLAETVEAEAGDIIAEYVVVLCGELQKAELPVSPRRARQIYQNIVWVHAARCVLLKDLATIGESTWLAFSASLPQRCSSEAPALAKLLAIHRQALSLSERAAEDPLRLVMETADPLKRVEMGISLGLDVKDLTPLITRGVASIECPARRAGIATALFLGLQDGPDLPPAVWEPLGKLASAILGDGTETRLLSRNRGDHRIFEEITARLARRPGDGKLEDRLVRNFLLAGVPDWWRQADWRIAEDQFRQDLERFSSIASAWAADRERERAA